MAKPTGAQGRGPGVGGPAGPGCPPPRPRPRRPRPRPGALAAVGDAHVRPGGARPPGGSGLGVGGRSRAPLVPAEAAFRRGAVPRSPPAGGGQSAAAEADPPRLDPRNPGALSPAGRSVGLPSPSAVPRSGKKAPAGSSPAWVQSGFDSPRPRPAPSPRTAAASPGALRPGSPAGGLTNGRAVSPPEAAACGHRGHAAQRLQGQSSPGSSVPRF